MKVNIVKESLIKPNKKFTLLSAFITLLNDRLSESILLPILPSFVLLFDSKASTYGLLSCTYQLAQSQKVKQKRVIWVTVYFHLNDHLEE